MFEQGKGKEEEVQESGTESSPPPKARSKRIQKGSKKVLCFKTSLVQAHRLIAYT